MLIFMNIVKKILMCFFIENVLILKLSAYVCLFFTNFVLVFHKISRACAYYKVLALLYFRRKEDVLVLKNK